MYKNIKSKIILISVLIGLILIGTLGFLYINSLAQIPQLINEQESRVLIQAKKMGISLEECIEIFKSIYEEV